MRKFYFQAIIIALSCILFAPQHLTSQTAGDFRSNASGDWDIESTWQIFNGSNWISTESGQIPRLSNNVIIQNGHNIVLKSTSECKSLHIIEGGILNIAGKSLYTYDDVHIAGRLKGSNLPNSSFGSWYIRGDYPTVNIDGILGGTYAGSDGEGVNIFMYHTSGTKLLFQGNGEVNISSLLVKSASAKNYIADIDIDMNLKNAYTVYPAMSLQNLTSGINSERIINILAKKTVRITDPSGCFHSIQTSGVNNSGGKMTYNIFGTLDISAGRFNLSSNSVSIGNQLILNVLSEGEIIFGNTINLNTNLVGQTAPVINCHTGSKLLFKGSTAPAIECTAVSGAIVPLFPWMTLDKVEFDFSGVLHLNNHVQCKNFNVGKQAQLVVLPGRQITIVDSLLNNGKLSFTSDSTGTSTLVIPDNISGEGEFEFNQFLPSARNWYISSPLLDATVPDNYIIYSYNEQYANWEKINSGTVFSAAKGYIAQSASGNNLMFSGKKIQSDVTALLTRTPGNGYSGFNLVGNPFPSYLNISQISDNEHIEPSYWYRSKMNNRYVFDTYNIAGGISTSNSGHIVNQWIPPMQAFWLKLKPGNQNSILTFNQFLKGHQDNINNIFRIKNNDLIPVLRITISAEEEKDESVVYMYPDASDEIDKFDSYKLSDLNSPVEIFSIYGQSKLAINGIKQTDSDFFYNAAEKEVRIGVKCKKNEKHTIQFNQSNFSSENTLVFKDQLKNLEIPVNDGFAYDFLANEEFIYDRFSILIKVNNQITSTNNLLEETTVFKRLDLNKGMIHIISNHLGKSILYDITGKRIKQ